MHADAPVHVPVHAPMAVIPVCAPLHATMHQPTRQCTCSGSNPCSQPCSSAKILRPQSVRRATGLILAAASTSSCTTLAKGPAASAGSFALLVTSTVSSTPTRRFAVRTAAYAQPAGDCVPSAALSWYTSSAARAGAIFTVEGDLCVCQHSAPGREKKERTWLDEQQRPVPSEILRSKAVSGNQAGLLTHTAHSPTA